MSKLLDSRWQVNSARMRIHARQLGLCRPRLGSTILGLGSTRAARGRRQQSLEVAQPQCQVPGQPHTSRSRPVAVMGEWQLPGAPFTPSSLRSGARWFEYACCDEPSAIKPTAHHIGMTDPSVASCETAGANPRGRCPGLPQSRAWTSTCLRGCQLRRCHQHVASGVTPSVSSTIAMSVTG
jgi:hypothetical protein